MKITYPDHPTLVRREISGEETSNVTQSAHSGNSRTQMQPISLRRVLQVAGIQPFTIASVERYKEKKARLWNWTDYVTWTLIPLFLLSIVATVVMAVLTVVDVFHTITWTGVSPKYCFGVGLFLLLVLGAVISVFANLCEDTIYVTRGVWSLVPFEKHQGEIPDFVLDTMQEIQMRFPDAVFRVDELRFHQVLADPFLVVEDPTTGTAYYIEVWDEPGFRRIA